MLSFYIDHNVNGKIIDGLRRRGVNCLTAYDDGSSRAKDPIILQRATDLERVVLSQDLDLIDIGWEWVAQGSPFDGVIYAPQLNLSIGQVIFDVQLIAEVMGSQEMCNTIIRLPL